MIEKLLRIGALLDFYGALLTEKQRRCLEMHFLNDLSLSEIADEVGVSRQAVYDIIHRSEQVLEEYELKLGIINRYQSERQDIQRICAELEALPNDIQSMPEIKNALEKLSNIVAKTEEA